MEDALSREAADCSAAWMFFKRGPRSSHDHVYNIGPVFDEMIRLGADPQALLEEIKSDKRDRTEPWWTFKKRMEQRKDDFKERLRRACQR